MVFCCKILDLKLIIMFFLEKETSEQNLNIKYTHNTIIVYLLVGVLTNISKTKILLGIVVCVAVPAIITIIYFNLITVAPEIFTDEWKTIKVFNRPSTISSEECFNFAFVYADRPYDDVIFIGISSRGTLLGHTEEEVYAYAGTIGAEISEIYKAALSYSEVGFNYCTIVFEKLILQN